MKRPNIIIFNPDQMRADALGHLGNEASQTGFLDKLASEEGVSFRNAFCQNPVCVPSRCSFSTGLYPHVRGHRTMEYLLRAGESTIFKELKDSGYNVWVNARNDLIAGQVDGLIQEHVTDIYYGGNSSESQSPENPPYKIPGGRGYYSMYNGKLECNEKGISYGQDDEDVDAAIEYMKSKSDTDEPVCIFLGLFNPHPPYQVEDPYFSAIDRSKLPQRIKGESTTNKAKIHQLIRENQELSDFTEEEWDEIRACYLGMCMKVDVLFEKFCNALKEMGEYDNSIILFFSDHGDYTGDFGIAEKAQNTFEDCLTNVPFIIKPPIGTDVDVGISDSMVELVDFYATVQDYAQLSPTHTQFGISLKNVVENRNTSRREYVHCEGGRMAEETHCDEFHVFGENGPHKFNPYWPRLKAQSDSEAHSKGIMIRSDRFKYISRAQGMDEFYDMHNDARECHNIINDEKYKPEIQKMQTELMRWMIRTSDIVPFEHDERFNFEMKWAKMKKYVPQEHVAEFKQRVRDGENLFALMGECQQRFAQ